MQVLDAITDYATINRRRRSQQHFQASFLWRAMRLQRLAIAPDVFIDYASIDGRRKSQQHWQILLLLRTMRRQHDAIVPDVIIDYAAPEYAQEEPASLAGFISPASVAVAAACRRADGITDHAAVNGRRKSQQRAQASSCSGSAMSSRRMYRRLRCHH